MTAQIPRSTSPTKRRPRRRATGPPSGERHAPYLQALEEIERDGIPGLVEVLREESIDGARYALWDATGWHRDYSPAAWRSRATKEEKRKDWEMAVRIEKIIATVLDEAHGQQAEEVMEALSEGPEGFYESPPN